MFCNITPSKQKERSIVTILVLLDYVLQLPYTGPNSGNGLSHNPCFIRLCFAIINKDFIDGEVYDVTILVLLDYVLQFMN